MKWKVLITWFIRTLQLVVLLIGLIGGIGRDAEQIEAPDFLLAARIVEWGDAIYLSLARTSQMILEGRSWTGRASIQDRSGVGDAASGSVSVQVSLAFPKTHGLRVALW